MIDKLALSVRGVNVGDDVCVMVKVPALSYFDSVKELLEYSYKHKNNKVGREVTQVITLVICWLI